MRKIKFLLRYGLACSSLTISCSFALAQSTDEPPQGLPPIVQAADNPTETGPSDDLNADETLDALPPIVQAAETSGEESAANEANGASSANAPLPPIIQAAKDADQPQEPAAFNHAQEMPRQGASSAPSPFGSHSTSWPFGLQPLKPMLSPNTMIQTASVDPSTPANFPQQISTTIPAHNVPLIYSPADLAAQPPAQTQDVVDVGDLQAQFAVPAGPTGGFPLTGNPSSTTETNRSPQSSPTISTRQDLIDPQMATPADASDIVWGLHSTDDASTGSLSSGFNSRGQCAHCGGAGCNQCIGTAPVMPYESAVVSPEVSGGATQAYDCCGFMISAKHYASVDYLYYERNGDLILSGNFSGYNDFDFARGGRVTLGHRFDATSGDEISYMGFDPWIVVTTETDAGGGLSGNLVAGPGFVASSLSAFDNATFLEQFQKTDLQSFEFNRTQWGWDVIKTSLGVRYILFDDEFRLSSANTLGEQGIYSLETENRLIGPQLGLELFYDVGYRLSFSMVSKIGAYANVHRGTTSILNDNDVELNNAEEETSFSFAGEVGLHGHFQILPRVRARFGYDALGLFDVVTAADNYTSVITPSTGLVYQDDDNAVFHGVFAGVEFYR